MDLFPYPPVGFHFSVVFELFPQTPNDFRFQEVSGLDVEVEMEPVKEGGQNRFTHQLPVRTRYTDITLKRGMFMGSGITLWCKNAIENFVFVPTNILISLLNADHLPLQSWYVINAIPKKWSVSNFNAEQNSVVIESLVLSYNYFTYVSVESLVGAAASLSGGVSVSI
ncbi:phage tail protein [Foetidibacter luteolus]|uniref:phage tail protein n=1 Tax=Foetidibacter luteolus TaxID=2608880 RepID=UPI001A997ECF|nr:phage tail protein [Foetidibacter luteolus]